MPEAATDQAAFTGARTSLSRTCAPLIGPLVARRQALGWSQRDLAARIGVTDSLVSHWECGHRAPRLVNLIAWAEALGLRLAPLAVAAAAAEGGAKLRGSRSLDCPRYFSPSMAVR